MREHARKDITAGENKPLKWGTGVPDREKHAQMHAYGVQGTSVGWCEQRVKKRENQRGRAGWC